MACACSMHAPGFGAQSSAAYTDTMPLTQRKGKAHAATSQTPANVPSEVDATPDRDTELEKLREFKRQALSPIELADTFNLQSSAGKAALAAALWRDSFEGSLRRVRDANPALVQIIEAQISNSYDSRASEAQQH